MEDEPPGDRPGRRDAGDRTLAGELADRWRHDHYAPGGHLVIQAIRLGYQSEAAFSRAFKRFMGMPPGAARKQDPARTR